MKTKSLITNKKGRSRIGLTIWFTGLSASGKTTLALSLQSALLDAGISSVLLDADEIRKSINSDLGFSISDREENNRRAAEIAKVINSSGVVAIGSFITPTEKIRERIKTIIGVERFIMVYLDTPLEVCEKRDPKNLYRKARSGSISDFSGISSVFEIPKSPDFIVDGQKTVEENTLSLISGIKGRLIS
ncbi:MAG: adenylyl-sulfate kinase [Bacteroidales bacterium]|nr:adenylyl-sulfate kinase [Bacteroidales bacterium]